MIIDTSNTNNVDINQHKMVPEIIGRSSRSINSIYFCTSIRCRGAVGPPRAANVPSRDLDCVSNTTALARGFLGFVTHHFHLSSLIAPRLTKAISLKTLHYPTLKR
jgi:hypothetical protein